MQNQNIKYFPSTIIIPITCDTSTSVLSGESFLFFFLNPPSPALGSFPIFNSLEWFYCVLWWSVHPFDYNFFMFELHIIVIYMVLQNISSNVSCWIRYMFYKTKKVFNSNSYEVTDYTISELQINESYIFLIMLKKVLYIENMK